MKIENIRPIQKVSSLEGVSLIFEKAHYLPHIDLDGLIKRVVEARVSSPRTAPTQLAGIMSDLLPRFGTTFEEQLQGFRSQLKLSNGVPVDINIANTYDGFGLADVLPVGDGFLVRSIDDPLKRLDSQLGAKVPKHPLSKSEVIDFIEKRLGKRADLVQISCTAKDVDWTEKVRFLTHAVKVGDQVFPLGVHTSTSHLIKETDGSKPPKPHSWLSEFKNIGGIIVRKKVEPEEIITDRIMFSGNDDEKLVLARGIACEVEAALAREAGHRTPQSIAEARSSIGRNSPQTKANKVLSMFKGE
jgi:hypothetical protein